MSSDGTKTVGVTIVTLVVIVVLWRWCCLTSCGRREPAYAADYDAPTTERANGCPLDAVAYDRPAFASSWNDAYKVTDRFSKQEWWLVRMDGKWVVLPIESKEAVDVG